LDPETRERFKAEKGINVHGELCPDCQEKAEDSLKKDSLGFVTKGGYVPLDLKVKPLQFSAKMQRGIGRIDPQTFIDRNAPDLLAKAIMSSNRGVLHLAEMGRMDPAFLVSLNDLFRGRNFSRGGKQYEMDALIIGEMTLDELGGLYDKAPRSLIERLDLIEITYPLDPIAEEGILQKRIRTSRLANSPHISPRSLELVAETAVRTRLVEFKDGQEHVLSVGQKADLYSGKNVNGFTQSDRKKIEEDGRARSEGSFGMSPPELWNIVYQVASEQIRKSGEGNTCLDFVELKKQLEDYILHGFLSDSDRVMYSAELSAVAKKYDGWLLQTIERAYQDRFSERADQAVADYINEVDYLLDPRQVKVDPKTGEEVPIDIQFVTAFENDISDKTLNNDDTKPNSRRGFRIRMQNVAGRIIQEKKKRGDEDPQLAHVDFYSQLPGFEKGIKDFLKKQGLEDPKEALQSLTPNEEQSKKLTEMEGRLVREHGFCECCAPKLRIYVRDLLRKGQV
jgi:serine protein kinase